MRSTITKVHGFLQTKVDRLQGADPAALESKIQQYYGTNEGEDGEVIGGHVMFVNIVNTEGFFQMFLLIDGFNTIYFKSSM